MVLRVTARAADEEAARAMCEPVVTEIRQRLGINVYGVDSGSLQKAVVQLLLEKKMKIATAESCTAGLLSGRLTEVPGASSVFECGIAAYSAEIKHNLARRTGRNDRRTRHRQSGGCFRDGSGCP